MTLSRPHPSTPRRRARETGFSLPELVFGLTIVGILSSIAYPAFSSTLASARRSDALVALMSLQTQQERYRANHEAYGDLAQLGVASVSPSGHYEITLEAASPAGYSVRAAAIGAQRNDRACRHLRLTVDGLNLTYASGETDATANAGALNRRCWGQ
jgi:prepilin-type N-terminal cleavage/methylation domain-containing protein